MTQTATVMAVPAPGMAEETVARQTACGHDCENCAGCGAQAGSFTVTARTEIDVAPGDKVEIYSSGKVLGIAALVYLGPVVLFLLGYLLPAFLDEALRYACGGMGFVLGLAACVAYDRHMRRSNAITYQILRKI